MADLFDKIVNGDQKLKIQQPVPAITYSNSSKPPKWFELTIPQIISTLENIRDNIGTFVGVNAQNYDEKLWRDLFSKHLTDEVASAQSTTQTLPTFTMLAKIIHYANSNDEYQEKLFELDEKKIDKAIEELKSYPTNMLVMKVQENAALKDDAERLKSGENVIYYGAPGTGKSYAVEQHIKASASDHIVRTVFHPDTQNSDFVGSLKPVLEDGKDISYRFSPGPFSKALSGAYRDPSNMHWLVIEELNRAPAAAVFGELFQLLDRGSDGTGEYEVNFPSEEFAKWWLAETGADSQKMRLPSNLSIFATMNSADQGVFPIDTAFRRRWRQEYVPIDYTNAPEGIISLAVQGGNKDIPWRKFVELLNLFLIDEIGSSVSEDRLIGQHFLTAGELGAILPGKLLIYLWDDLLRHHGRDIIFRPDIRTYGELMTRQNNGKPVFSEKFLDTLIREQADV